MANTEESGARARPAASVIVLTYNSPGPLALVLEGFLRQSTRDFELCVADDGSTEETAGVVAVYAARAAFPLRHVWHEDRGFRKCRIVNDAVRAAAGDYLVFVDGDCVPHPRFVEGHLRARAEGVFLVGRRVRLGPGPTARLRPEDVAVGALDGPSLALWWGCVAQGSQHFARAFHVASPRWRRWLGLERVGELKGSNFSVARADYEAVDGYDEAYEGYYREDTDLELRLRHAGLRRGSVKALAIQYHLWHPVKAPNPENERRLDAVRAERRVRARAGLSARPAG